MCIRDRLDLDQIDPEFSATLNRIAVLARRLFYWHLWYNPEISKETSERLSLQLLYPKNHISPVERFLLYSNPLIFRYAVLPVIKKMITRSLRISLDKSKQDEQELPKLFEAVSARLDEHEYLTGDHFTVTDINFCAQSSIILAPPNHFGGQLNLQIPFDELPASLRSIATTLRETAAGKFALKMYEEQRI
eukprot:TRINITY_DN1503_c0_g2_i1.p1 TRINITY_DN1503_c0_g2~~TRINITY_DN1503_c0_g2_i1.p1  ORF type:complete len:191 (-),score=22.80 TRINITY_DN1503_c0_g2_i1:151-723(-)